MPKLRLAILATLLLALLVPGAASATSPATAQSAAGCAGQHAVPTASNLRQIRAAVRCLVNRERRARGLSALRYNQRLRWAATRHSRDMAGRDYFAHVSRNGASMTDRIRRTGYTRGGSWSIGENIAWGTGGRATPTSIMRSWMGSPGHRANILSGRFRELGVGVAVGAPVRGLGQGATYTQNFGRRS